MSEVKIITAIWEASPVIGALLIFAAFLVKLAKIGVLNFKISGDDDLHDRLKKLEDTIGDLATKIAILMDRWDRKD